MMPDSGIVQFMFYYMGEPIIFNIDDRIPIIQNSAGGVAIPNVSPQENGAFWQPMIEKAMAKYVGYYLAVEAGFNNEASHILTGMPGEAFATFHEKMNAEKLWKMVSDGEQLHF